MKIKFELSQLNNVSLEVKKQINNKIVLISGEMGVGKTTLIKELLSSMDVIDNVSSPTFSIINQYATIKNEIIYHIDLYRIKDISDLDNIGFFEYLESGNYCFIEWGNIVEKLIDQDFNKFILTKKEKFRVIKKIK
tara:strand:- start:1501 stop:1908 length:408 start_codon:yes stop_codon:yes gene_type:complete